MGQEPYTTFPYVCTTLPDAAESSPVTTAGADTNTAKNLGTPPTAVSALGTQPTAIATTRRYEANCRGEVNWSP